MTVKPIISTILYYGVGLAIVFVLEKISPSGPCTLGLGVLSFFLLILIAIRLLIKNIYLAIKTGKADLIIVITHIVAVATIFFIANHI